MLGTCTGQLKLYNVFTGQEEASYSCHSSAITHLEPSRVSGENPPYARRFHIAAEFTRCPHLFTGRLPALNLGLLELPHVRAVGHEVSVHHEVSTSPVDPPYCGSCYE